MSINFYIMSAAIKELFFFSFNQKIFFLYFKTRLLYKLNSCILYGTDAKPCSLMGQLAFIYEQ